MFTHTVESTVCDESPKKKVDDTRGRGTSHMVDSTVCVNIEKSGGLGWTWPPAGYPLPPTTPSGDVITSQNVPPNVPPKPDHHLPYVWTREKMHVHTYGRIYRMWWKSEKKSWWYSRSRYVTYGRFYRICEHWKIGGVGLDLAGRRIPPPTDHTKFRHPPHVSESVLCVKNNYDFDSVSSALSSSVVGAKIENTTHPQHNKDTIMRQYNPLWPRAKETTCNETAVAALFFFFRFLIFRKRLFEKTIKELFCSLISLGLHISWLLEARSQKWWRHHLKWSVEGVSCRATKSSPTPPIFQCSHIR